MSIALQIRNDLPNFRGLYVNDAVPLATVSSLGVTMAWVLGQPNIAAIHNKSIRKILIAGNNKTEHPCYIPPHGQGTHPVRLEKGMYFIADIDRIENCVQYLHSTVGQADPAFRAHHSHIAYPLLHPTPMQFSSRRYAIYFHNPSPIQQFSSNAFAFSQNPVGRI